MNDLALWNEFVERPDWFDRRACSDTDVSVFFPARDSSNAHQVRAGVTADDFDAGERQAKAVCAGCPVRAECLAYGLHEPYGVWGGRTTRERRLIRKAAS